MRQRRKSEFGCKEKLKRISQKKLVPSEIVLPPEEQITGVDWGHCPLPARFAHSGNTRPDYQPHAYALRSILPPPVQHSNLWTPQQGRDLRHLNILIQPTSKLNQNYLVLNRPSYVLQFPEPQASVPGSVAVQWRYLQTPEHERVVGSDF